mgnify:CR=1 FL=1
MSNVIEWVLEMKVQDGQAGNVQPLIDEMVAATMANEPGALHYEYYMTEDGSMCTVLERYAEANTSTLNTARCGGIRITTDEAGGFRVRSARVSRRAIWRWPATGACP